MKTFEFETDAIITPYSSLGPNNMPTKENSNLLSISTFSEYCKENGYVRCGKARVIVTLDATEDDLIQRKVEGMRAEQKKIRAKAQHESDQLEEKIQSLLAISFNPSGN